MAGLIAILTPRSAAPATAAATTDLAGLERSYTTLRGAGEFRHRLAGGLGVAAVCGADTSVGAGCRSVGASWVLHVGQPHVAGELVGAAPPALDGQFALISYDAAAGRVDIVTDAFGLQAIYVADRDGSTYVSTSALALARHLGSRPSVGGLETFLLTGPHFGELTGWEGIRRVPPATRLSLRRGQQPEEVVYWRPSIDASIARMELTEAAHHCVEVCVATFRDRLAGRDRACCDLTGGYDSRLATLLLDRAGVRFETVTNGEADSADVVLGSRVAAAAGWPWLRCALPDDWSEHARAAVADAVAWGDGQMEATQLAEVLTLQGQVRRGHSSLFGGGGGEHWRDRAWKQEIPLGGRTTRVNFNRWVNVAFLHAQDLSPLRSDPTRAVRADLVARCRAYAAPYAELVNSAQLDMLYAYKSMGHFGAYQSASRGTIHAELPFYFRDAFAAVFSVAPAHRNYHRLMRQSIPLLDARIARLPTTVGGPAEPFRAGNAHRFLPYLEDRARGIARKLTEHLPGPTIGAMSTAAPAAVLAMRRRMLRELVDATALDPARMRAGRLYDARGLERLAASPTATTSGWTTLGRIITVELSLAAADAALD
jgi:hypothetical protein